MVTIRLFASLRESAQTGRVELDADSVADALDQAVERFGDRFARGLATAQIWVNGSKAERATPLNSGDEMALIPPVSGGATTLREPTDVTQLLFTGTLGGTVLIANLISAEALAFAAVGAMIAWLWDIADTYAARLPAVQIIPAMAAATAGATAAYRWGQPGLAGGVALGIMLALAWTVFDRANRPVDAFAVSVLLSGVAALGCGSLVIVRLRSTTEATAFIAIAGVAAVAAWFGRRFGGASLDPNLAILLVTLAAGTAAGGIADSLDLVVMLLASAVTAGGLIAGRALGSMVRNGDVLHTVRGPGMLTMLDPAVVGVSLWWASLVMFSPVVAG
jgi:molybdopterin synthase catalytic subunit/molybdopterin synthase sulfur carrier subunit